MSKKEPKPILVRHCEIPEMRQGLNWVRANRAGDAIIYGHLGSCEDVVQDVRKDGTLVIRDMSILGAHERAAGWGTQGWERFLWDLATEFDFWLHDRQGERVLFRWFAQGPIYNWAAAPKAAYTRIRNFLDDSAPRVGRHIYHDMTFSFLHSWMFLDRSLRIRDLADYGHLKYLSGIQKLLRSTGWPRRRVVRVNGEWNLDQSKILATYENADVGNQGRYLFSHTLPRWLNHPGSILTICGRPEALHVRRVIDFWQENGGWLWPEDNATADYAWSELHGSKEPLVSRAEERRD